jgi:hypothetical protein
VVSSALPALPGIEKMTTLLLFVLLGAAARQDNPQERPRVPKDSIELVISGCLKGRILAVSDVRQTDVQSGPIVRSKSFRLAGKRDVMDAVKREDRHFVEVTGLVKRSALIEPGVRVGKNIVLGGGSPVAGSGTRPSPSEFVPVMDVSAVRLRSASCKGE